MWWTLGAAALQSAASAFGQKKANDTNIRLARERMGFEDRQAQRQMAFQERMSNTAVRRSMADMKAAGLNPILAVPGGASTPGGAAGSGAQASVDSIVPENTVSSALALKTQKDSLELLREQIKKAKSDARAASHQASVRATERAFQDGRYAYYFGKDGMGSAKLRQLLDSEHAMSLANSARSVADADLARLSVPERAALARLFQGSAGAGVKGLQQFLPLLLRLGGR